METKQNIDCPLCKGETIQPYETAYDHHGNSIGLRSDVKWYLKGTTLYQIVHAEYITDRDLYYDEDFTPEVNYCIPVYGLSHCPCCRRRLVKSLKENDYKGECICPESTQTEKTETTSEENSVTEESKSSATSKTTTSSSPSWGSILDSSLHGTANT